MAHVGDNNLLYLQPKPLPQRKRRRQQQQHAAESKSESVEEEEAASSFASSGMSSAMSSLNETPNNESEEFFVISSLSVQEIDNLTTTTTNIIYHIRDENYEFLDHTADVLVHAHGTCIASTLSNAVLAMNCYMIEHPENINFTHSCEIHGKYFLKKPIIPDMPV